jgi:hypothetical protein
MNCSSRLWCETEKSARYTMSLPDAMRSCLLRRGMGLPLEAAHSREPSRMNSGVPSLRSGRVGWHRVSCVFLGLALGLAAAPGSHTLPDLVERKEFAAARAMVGADTVSTAQVDGMTALHWAVRHSDAGRYWCAPCSRPEREPGCGPTVTESPRSSLACTVRSRGRGVGSCWTPAPIRTCHAAGRRNALHDRVAHRPPGPVALLLGTRRERRTRGCPRDRRPSCGRRRMGTWPSADQLLAAGADLHTPLVVRIHADYSSPCAPDTSPWCAALLQGRRRSSTRPLPQPTRTGNKLPKQRHERADDRDRKRTL